MQEEELRKGPWLEEEDEQLIAIIALRGEKRWDSLATASGLRRSGKSCRMRWMNYLRPHLKHGRLSVEEERTILQLHKQWGNKWSKIAQSLPGRTDNEIKNYWRSHLRKKTEAEDDQEQGYFERFTNNSKQDLVVPNCDTSGLGSDNEDSLRTSDESCFHAFELSHYSIVDSPYETRLSDWLSGWGDEQSEVSHHGDWPSVEMCFGYPLSNCKDSNSSIWDSSVSLWGSD